MPTDDSDDQADPLGPARPFLQAALELGACAAGVEDYEGSHLIYACAARLARKLRGVSEVADFRLERALDDADIEGDPADRARVLREGLESLLQDDEAETESVPIEPILKAQRWIEKAILIGAPSYNTGDVQGCYDVYACTARAILAAVADLDAEPAAKLRAALAQCESLDNPDEQAWAMRHAFDAVGEMGPGKAGVALDEIRSLIARAISIGAPAFNMGDHRGCYEVYACTARLLVNSTEVPDTEKGLLREALAKASILPSVSRQAWVMREAFDVILGAAPETPGQP